MKNILSILLVSIILMGCSEKDVRKEWFFNDKNGKLKEEYNLKDGKEDGLARSYHFNGQLHWEGNYKDGERDGLWEYWHKNGQLEYEINYKDGK